MSWCVTVNIATVLSIDGLLSFNACIISVGSRYEIISLNCFVSTFFVSYK